MPSNIHCGAKCRIIEALTADQQLGLAQRVAGNLVQSRVLQGGFLLMIKRTESYENCGASSPECIGRQASGQLGAKRGLP